MGIESLLVFALVSASFVYAAWQLMPQSARRALALGLLRLPLPARVNVYLAQAAQSVGACNCSGCGHATVKRGSAQKAGQPPAQVLVFHPRKK